MLKAKKRNPFKAAITLVHWFDGAWHKIQLKNRECKSFHEFHYHDEGWSSLDHNLIRYGSQIVLTTMSDGRDCDGRLSQFATGHCFKSNIWKNRVYRPKKGDPKRRPMWDFTERSQRDYSAEAMGY